jgi:homoserine kinase
MNRPMVRVRVPASTANLGPGFDAFGMALALYAWLEMQEIDDDLSSYVELIGDQVNGLPVDESNLLIQCAYQVYDRAGFERKPLLVRIYSEIPLTRGLGSSASAIVGGMAAANALLGSPLSDQELFRMATELEHHPDNVGAALFGGFIAATWDGPSHEPVAISIPVPKHLGAIVAIPQFELSTEKARKALPDQYDRADAVFNLSRTAMLIAALSQGRLDRIGDAMRDRIHQPYRSALVPGLQTILEGAVTQGALGVALSGAGPTMLALVDREDSQSIIQLTEWMAHVLAQQGIEAEMLELSICESGVQIDWFEHSIDDGDQSSLHQFAQERMQKQVSHK